MTKSPERRQFQSQPLAGHQQSLLEQTSVPDRSRQVNQTKHEEQVNTAPPVVVDLNLNDIPDAVYEDFTFQLGDYIYTLSCESDSILYELHDLSLEDSYLRDMFEYFLTNTFSSGKHVEDDEHVTVDHLIDQFYPSENSKSKPYPIGHLQRIMLGALDQWSSELQDTSMRVPNRPRHQASRAERRRRR